MKACVTAVLSQVQGRQHGVPQIMVGAVIHHVLEYHHAKPIAGIIEELRLHLDVLAQGIETQVFHSQDVFVKALGVCRCPEAVAPIALVQNAMEEIGLAVQTQPRHSVYGFDVQGPECKVALHPVLPRLDDRFIEVRVLRGPGSGV